MSEPVLVDTPDALEQLCTDLARVPIACIDAEGPGQGAFPDRLCLLVISAGGAVSVVDPFRVDVRRLAPEFSRHDRPLVVHDVAYDARLFGLSRLPIGLVHDTAVAASMLGKPKTGLASLALELLGVTVDKSLQSSAWARRPLDARAMAYLAGDAELPLAVHAVLWPALQEADLLDEVLTETAYRINKAYADAETSKIPGWWKLTSARGLSDRGRRWLRSAWIARDALARKRDRAPALFLPNDELEALCRRVPSDAHELRQMLQGRAKDAALVAALQQALACADDAIPEAEREQLEAALPSGTERERGKQRRKRLNDWRGVESRTRGVSELAILPGHLADRLSAIPNLGLVEVAAIAGMGTRRAERYGSVLMGLLEDR